MAVLWPQRDSHWSLYGWMLLLLMLSMRLQLSLQVCSSTCPETVPGNWSSNLRMENRTAREVTLAWMADDRLGATLYVVQFRELNVTDFNTSSPITATSYTIDNLIPNTNYEGQVCRANGSVSDPDNCGSCLFCFSTRIEVPMQVQNVRVFVYFPMLSGRNVSALVTWDALTAMQGGGFVQNYTVQVFQNGQLLPEFCRQFGNELEFCSQLYQNPDNRTTYTVQQRVVDRFGLSNSVRYPLVENMEYVVRVFASNPTGDGPPSANVTFNTNMVSPPQQVIAVGASESQLVQPGNVPSPLSSVREPLTVDTTGRQLYWYNGNMIQRQSLDGGDPQPINVGEVDVRALAYNWLGQTLYFAGRVERGGVGRVGVWVYHTINDRVEEVFVGDSLEGEGLRLVVDPFRGYLYWTIANDSSNSLHQLNLQDPSMSSPLTVPSSPMSERQATPTLSSLSLTPALALSPRTGRLWVCDANSGDTLSCSPVNGGCTVEVEAAALGRNDIGLPATSLTLDELRVYWTNDTSGIFAVAFPDNTTVIEISPTTTASSVVSLSPGQQPLPSQDCLSPFLDIIMLRPLAELVSRTNTSITVNWTAPTLEPSCTNVFFPPSDVHG